MASLTTENIVRTYLKENVTSKDEILDMLCEKMDDLGVESIDDFKDLDESDIDGLGLKKIHKKKMMRLVTGEITNNNTTGSTLKEIEKQYRLPGDKFYESSDYRDALKCYLKWKDELISFYNNTKNESSIELMVCMVKLGETYEKVGEYDLSMKYWICYVKKWMISVLNPLRISKTWMKVILMDLV